jgi:hypothetical protein
MGFAVPAALGAQLANPESRPGSDLEVISPKRQPIREVIMNSVRKRTGLCLVILLVGVLVLSGCGPDASDSPQTKDEIPRISPETLKSRIEGGESILVVDARSAGEFASRHIPGSISVPLGEVASRLDEFPRDQEIVFYCT